MRGSMGEVQLYLLDRLERKGRIVGIGQAYKDNCVTNGAVSDMKIRNFFDKVKKLYPNATMTTKTTLYKATIKLNRECDN